MKKILKKSKNFFIKAAKIFDKVIIIPITKLIVMFRGNYDKSGKKFERWLSNKSTLLFISLFVSLTIFIMVDRQIISFSQSSAEVLKNQPVEVKYNEEAYVVEGVPDSVDITIIGNETEIYIAKQSSGNGVKLDLTGLGPGTHKVSLTYSQTIGTVDYTVNPATANITIYQKASETRMVGTDVLNQEKLDSKLSIKSINIGIDQVVIKGAKYKLEKVANVKALIDVNNIVTQEVGTIILENVSLKAYDENGNVVDVEILPATLSATIEIISSNKTVPIKIIPKGETAFGYAIESISSNATSVTVYGTEEVLNTLEYIPVEIDVTGLSADKEYRIELEKPVGIKDISVVNITVLVSLAAEANKEIANVPIEYLNIDENVYSVQAASQEDSQVTVSIKGAQSVIETITEDNLKAYINLSGYKEGTYEVDVVVEGSDLKVEYTAKTKKVKIIITKKA